jgi:glycosyltransferase involved in cell wall biosynthesis
MKVLIFNEAEAWGGLEAHTVDLAQTLAAAGHQPSIVCIGGRAFELFRPRVSGAVGLVNLGSPRRRGFLTWWRTVKPLDGDVAIFQMGTLFSGQLALDIALRLRFRRYVAVQHLEPPELPPRTRRRHFAGLIPGVGLWWYRWKWSGYLRSLAPTKIVCVSDSVRRALAADYGFDPGKLVTIHNGVDTGQFRPDLLRRESARRAWGVSDDVFVFGSVRRFIPQKGLDVAVEAFAQLMADTPSRDARLVLIGEGPERAALISLAARLGVSDRVIFPGFTDSPWNVYPGFDVFVIPSRIEALGVVVAEAMACNCLVVGSRVGGIPEMVSNPSFGDLVPPGDSAALADAMRRALSMDPDERLLRVGRMRQHVVEHFNARTQFTKVSLLLE